MAEHGSEVTRTVTRGAMEVRLIRACSLEVIAGPDAGTTVRMEKPIFRIGSHTSNDLVLSDTAVSKSHLELLATPAGYRLSDLSSSNGTFLAALRVNDLTTTEEVVLRLGRTQLRLTPIHEEVEVPAPEQTRFGHAWGRSAVMRELFGQLEIAARSDCTVVLEGETGVGKEVIAESLHERSARRGGPFRVVDCGAMVGPLMESELFGHVRGAFSGAEADRDGLLVAADGGTVFLDEIGELPLPLQVKLLGALERRRVTPVGTSRSRPIDVRVVAATHRNLAREVNEGRFRADLFYRLAVVLLRVPPLRERLDDLPLLVNALLTELRERLGPDVRTELSAVVLAQFAAHTWPGNVRELRNAIERSVLATMEPASSGTGADARHPKPAKAEAFPQALRQFLIDHERAYLQGLIARANGSMSEAARLAQMDRRQLYRLVERHQIPLAGRKRS